MRRCAEKTLCLNTPELLEQREGQELQVRELLEGGVEPRTGIEVRVLREYVRGLGFSSKTDWEEYCKSGLPGPSREGLSLCSEVILYPRLSFRDSCLFIQLPLRRTIA